MPPRDERLQATILEHHEALWRHCRVLSPTDSDADDLLQETLLIALAQRPDLDRPLLPWLKMVARNAHIDRLRRQRRQESLEDEPPAEPLHAREPLQLQAVLVAALQHLSLLQLCVLLLRDALGLSSSETARLLGLEPGNVRVMAHRARELVRSGASPDVSAVRAFTAHMTGHRIDGLGMLVDLVRGEGEAPGELRAALRGRAAQQVWEALLQAALGFMGEQDAAGTAHALASLAASAEALGRPGQGLVHYEEAARWAEEAGLDELAMHARVRCALLSMAWDLPGDAAPSTELSLVQAGRAWRAGRFHEALTDYEARLDGPLDARWRAALLNNAALVGSWRGDLEQALERATQAVELHHELGDPNREAIALNTLGMVLQNARLLDQAEECFHAARALHTRLGAVHGSARCWNNLGLVHHERQDLGEAAACFLRARRLHRQDGHVRSEAIATANLGVTAHVAGDRDTAAIQLELALNLIRGQELAGLEAFARAHLAAALHDPAEPDDQAPRELHRASELLAHLDPEDPQRGVLAAVRALLEGAPQDLAPIEAQHAGRSAMVRIAVDVARKRLQQAKE